MRPPARLLLTASMLTWGLAWMLPAAAAEPVTVPAMYPPDTWEGRASAQVRVLDRLDAHVETLTIPAGQSGRYKTLTIAVRRCLQHPQGLSADAAASLAISDAIPATNFDGWLFAAEPSAAVFQSPVFGVQLVACGGDAEPPAAPPLPSVLPLGVAPGAAPDLASGLSPAPLSNGMAPDVLPNAVYPSEPPNEPQNGPQSPPSD